MVAQALVNLSLTQNTCHFTDGKKPLCDTCVCVCVCVAVLVCGRVGVWLCVRACVYVCIVCTVCTSRAYVHTLYVEYLIPLEFH